MTRFCWCLLLAFALPTAAAYGDPIPITQGSLVVTADGLGILHILGTEGFRFDGVADGTSGFGSRCISDCVPGQLFAPGGVLNDIAGTARVTIDGQVRTFQVNSFGPASFGTTQVIADSIVVPSVSESALLSAPFEFRGQLIVAGPDLVPETLLFPFLGRGTARIQLTGEPATSPHVWAFKGSTYDFAATPEPGTFSLLAGALAAALLCRRLAPTEPRRE
jgi:hypothetical protein